MKSCTACSEDIEREAKFCKYCGAQQNDSRFLPSDEGADEVLSRTSTPVGSSLDSRNQGLQFGGSSNSQEEMALPKTPSSEFNIRSFLLIGFAGQVSAPSLEEMIEATFPSLTEARIRDSGSPNESKMTANVLGFFPYEGGPGLTQFLETLEDQCSDLMQDYCDPSLFEDEISVEPFGGVAVVRIDQQLTWEINESPELAQVMLTELEFWIDLEVLGKFQVLESSYDYDEPKISSQPSSTQPLSGDQHMSFRVVGVMDWGADAKARNQDAAKHLAIEEVKNTFEVVCVDTELDPEDWTAYEWEFHEISDVSSPRNLIFGRTGNFEVEGYLGFSVEIETEGPDLLSCSNKAREVFTRFWKIRNLDLDVLIDFEIRSVEVGS